MGVVFQDRFTVYSHRPVTQLPIFDSSYCTLSELHDVPGQCTGLVTEDKLHLHRAHNSTVSSETRMEHAEMKYQGTCSWKTTNTKS